MALPPSSMMRATLCANSSISAEPPLTGSDGALTVTPQSAVLAWARHGLPRHQMDCTLDGIKTPHGPSQGSPAPAAATLRRADLPGLTLLSSYWSNTRPGAQLLELTTVSRIRGEWAECAGQPAA